MNTTSLKIIAGVVALGATATTATATLFAYEGFDAPELNGVPGFAAPDGTTLDLVTTSPGSGVGFVGAWQVSNGNSTDSVFQAGGLSYPAGYTGTLNAVGGNGLNKGNSSNSMLRLNLDPAVAANVNATDVVWVSYLAQRVGPTTAGFDNPYPRNAGARFNNDAGVTNNNSMGMIGYNGSAAENNGVGAWGWKDTHGLMTDPLAEYVSAADLVVVRLNRALEKVTVFVNPNDGLTAWEGALSFNYTDGGSAVNMNLFAFGVEAGSNSGGREPGEWVFDEIRIADTYNDVAGMAVPEPSTYALILGVFAAVGVYFHRRRRNA